MEICMAIILIALILFFYIERNKASFLEHCEKVKLESEKNSTEALNKIRQEQADRQMFNGYSWDVRNFDAGRIMESDTKTRKAIKDFPFILTEVTDKQIEKYSERYNEYKKKSEVLFGMPPFLSQKEFTAQMLNPELCASFNCIFLRTPQPIYLIYDWETAKYREDAEEKLKQEFKEKYY